MSAIVVIDYHKGNLSSVRRGLMRAGWDDVVISDDPAAIRAAAGLVLPGVGSFYDAIEFMRESGQDEAMLEAIGHGVPFLGICLGLQLLCARGDEGVPAEADASVETADAAGGPWTPGLGVLAGSVARLESARLKVPHVGWDQLHVTEEGRDCPLLAGVPEGANVYFTHSYAVADDADASQVAARTHYVRSFPCVAWRDNVFGCQFHPEKSSATGLMILRNFVSIVKGASTAPVRVAKEPAA
ncbi:imidazole glycerol phosphate synthase subunit HisH [uncultured Parolsenella sp.]|mgnify:CR=1 FL=1|uniref:imidazole glycerol phosphate synthase subunit HisH n=1 Tax=uncultured Parolsenella sp. TaxID=2083008 RepID=UPI0025F6489F|nr:imidazole glycerol phosphate synthase subunit HisH [uncultured Parolsenella sp.]